MHLISKLAQTLSNKTDVWHKISVLWGIPQIIWLEADDLNINSLFQLKKSLLINSANMLTFHIEYSETIKNS